MLLLLPVALALADDLTPAPTPPRCPMLPSESAVDASLLVDRVVVHVDPTDAVVVNGLTLAGWDPHLVVPMAAWRDSIKWIRAGDVAAIVAEDPILLAGDDLSAGLRVLPLGEHRSGALRREGLDP